MTASNFPQFPNEMLCHRFWRSVHQSPEAPCVIVEDMLQNYVALNYAQCGMVVAHFLEYLESQGVTVGEKVAIMSKGCFERRMAVLATLTLGAVEVGIDFRFNDVSKICGLLDDSKSMLAFLESSNLARSVQESVQESVRNSCKITTFSEALPFLEDWQQDSFWEIPRTARFAQVRSSLSPGESFLGITPAHTALILYTSGSSDRPRGVVFTHGNIASKCSALTRRFPTNSKDLYLSCLPGSHCLDHINGDFVSLWNRVPVFYCSPKPAEQFARHLLRVGATIQFGVPALWDAILNGVKAQLDQIPRTLRLRLEQWYVAAEPRNALIPIAGGKCITASVVPGGAGSQPTVSWYGWLWRRAAAAVTLGSIKCLERWRDQTKGLRFRFACAILGAGDRILDVVRQPWNAKKAPGKWLADLLLWQVRKKLGRRLRLAVTGGAKLPPETLADYSRLGLPLLNGYGSTEIGGSISALTPSDPPEFRDTCGQLLDDVEVCFLPVEGVDFRDGLAGLLLVRGPGVATCYHNRPLETAETFLAGGWCNTGDIAELVLAPEGVLSASKEDGRLVFAGANQKSVYLRLIEKESNREKLLNAEFVTFDEVQRRFKQREGCQIIAYVAPVIEDRPFVGALFFINLPVAIALLQEHGVVLPEEDKLYAFCAQHALVHEAVRQAVNATNGEVKEPFKRVSGFAIVSQEPSNINGWLSIKNEVSVRRVRKVCPALIGKIYGTTSAESIGLLEPGFDN